MEDFENIFAKTVEKRLKGIANQIQELSDFISDCGGNGTAIFDIYRSGYNRMNLPDIAWTLEDLNAATFLEEKDEE